MKIILCGKWVLLKQYFKLYAIQNFRAAGRGKGGQGSAQSAAASQARAEKPKPKRATSSASGKGRNRGRPATNAKTLQKQRAKTAHAAVLHDDPTHDHAQDCLAKDRRRVSDAAHARLAAYELVVHAGEGHACTLLSK